MLINEDLRRIFGNKYYTKICAFIETLQTIIDTHDVVIFMARKAYCFYKALLSNKLINTNNNCLVLSSRAVTYNGINLSNGHIAIIEDVVILGESLSEIIFNQKFSNTNINIYMLACSKEFVQNTSKSTENINFFPSFMLEKNDLLELATLITNYIIYEMIPYNADYPIYGFKFTTTEEINQSFNNYSLCLLSDLVHCKNDAVLEAIIPFDDDVFSDILPESITSNLIVKTRIYINYEKKNCYLVPIVIFPLINTHYLDELFNDIFNNEYEKLITTGDSCTTTKNKLRILCYKLSDWLATNYFSDFFQKYKLDKLNCETELFSSNLSNSPQILQSIKPINIKRNSCPNSLELYNSLGYAYDLLIDNFHQNPTHNFEFTSEFISFEDINNKLSIVENEHTKLKLLSSLILDVFIDNGVIVPRIHCNDASIVRIFKFGEVARLTVHDFALFAMVLGEYADLLKRTLDKTELEKISVIFFRKYNNNFNVENNESEAYRICYSKFGPRISSSANLYSVPQGQALTDKLLNYNFITSVGDKYNIIDYSQPESLSKVDMTNRSIFAGKMYKLHQYYTTAQSKEPQNPIFTYVNSYIRLLTLLAIGSKEEDRVLSLIAEVDLIKSKSLSKHHDIKQVISILNGIIDGILSGIWKYFCYSNTSLSKDTFQLLCSSSNEENAIYSIDFYIECLSLSEKIEHTDFLEEIGKFLYDVAIFNYYVSKHYNVKPHSDYGKQPYKQFLKDTWFNDIHKKYKYIFSQDQIHIDNYINNHLKAIDITSCDILDKYHVYETISSPSFDSYSECVVLFNINSNIGITINQNNFYSFVDKDILIIPIKKETKDVLINSICSVLCDINIKALYYVSSDNSINLYTSAAKFFGTKFLEEIHKVVSYIRQNITTTTAKELLIMPKTDFDNSKFHTTKYHFDFIQKSKYNSNKNIYQYYFQEDVKMNVSTINNYGNINLYELNIDIEQVSGDLNLANSKCKDPEIKKHIEEAETALKQNDHTKFKECLKWLGEHAMDFIKTTGSAILVNLITGSAG